MRRGHVTKWKALRRKRVGPICRLQWLRSYLTPYLIPTFMRSDSCLCGFEMRFKWSEDIILPGPWDGEAYETRTVHGDLWPVAELEVSTQCNYHRVNWREIHVVMSGVKDRAERILKRSLVERGHPAVEEALKTEQEGNA